MSGFQIAGVIAGILFGIINIFFFVYNILKNNADKNENKADKIEDKRDVLQQSHFGAQMTGLSKDIDSNNKQSLLLFQQLKEGQDRIEEDVKERKQVSSEAGGQIRFLEDRVTKLEARVARVEEMVDDIKEIKEMVKELSLETRKEIKSFLDEIGKIKISLFNAGMK